MAGLDTYLRGWHPDPLIESDALLPDAARALAAVLDAPAEGIDEGQPLPPLWHWVYFLSWPPQTDLGADGHPGSGHFLPPLPDRRRMFAGGSLEVFEPLLLGQATERISTLSDTEVKHGRSGEMVFATVRSEYRQRGRLRLVEDQSYVYRSGEGDAKRAATEPRPTDHPRARSSWQRPFVTDPVRLFRFSALTANSHRIHYDEPYAREVEAYPGLVVHGPMLTLLMADLARRSAPESPISTVDYRLRRPVFCGDPILITGEPGADDTATMAVLTAPDQTMAEATIRFGA